MPQWKQPSSSRNVGQCYQQELPSSLKYTSAKRSCRRALPSRSASAIRNNGLRDNIRFITVAPNDWPTPLVYFCMVDLFFDSQLVCSKGRECRSTCATWEPFLRKPARSVREKDTLRTGSYQGGCSTISFLFRPCQSATRIPTKTKHTGKGNK